MNLGQAHDCLVAVVRTLKKRKDVCHKLANLRKDGIKTLAQREFVWCALVRSMATMGRARAWEKLKPLYGNVAYARLQTLPRAKRRSVLDVTLREAGVRMYPPQKPDWLAYDFALIEQMGGLTAAKNELLGQEGPDAKMTFLRQFKGIGPKYSRNIMMETYHKEFRDYIAIDVRIKNVSKALGLTINVGRCAGYEKCEKLFRKVARSAGINGWTLDRLLFFYTEDVLSGIDKLKVRTRKRKR